MRRLHEILSNSAQVYSDRTAVIDTSGDRITYDQLAEEVDKLTIFLKKQGLKRHDRIGVLLPKSIESLTAILSILKLNAVYVPLDISAPLSRNIFILKNCKANAVFMDESIAPHYLPEINGPLIDYSDISLRLMQPFKEEKADQEFPLDLAYILYTSGSTGDPKGVMVSHHHALSFINWAGNVFDLNQNHVFSSIAPFHFDLSIFDIFTSLKAGGSIVLIDYKSARNPMMIAELIEEHKISVCYATPTLLKTLLTYGRLQRYNHNSLEIILFAGEVFDIAPLRQLKYIWHQAIFFNLYGPTETNVVTWYPIPDSIPEERALPYPIGKSCAHVQCKIYNKTIEDPTPEKQGELVVCGDSVSYGYVNLPDKNKESFLKDDHGKLWYRTGDWVEINDDLNFVYVNRIDRMVKRRGYRIELGEIEAALMKHPHIIEVALISEITATGNINLYAYYSLKSNSNNLNTLELKEHCLQYMPMYMLPDSFIYLDELPKTSSFKIDYQSLKNQTV